MSDVTASSSDEWSSFEVASGLQRLFDVDGEKRAMRLVVEAPRED